MDTRTQNAVLEVAGRLDDAAAEMDRARSDRARLVREYHERGDVSSPEARAAFHDATARYYTSKYRVRWLTAALQALSQGAE